MGTFIDFDPPGDAEVVFFIAAEWYEGSGAGQHISYVAPKNANGMLAFR